MTTSAASYATEQEDAEPTPAARSTGYIEFVNVKKVYRMGEQEIEALAGVNFSIDEGQLVIIAGASGAGKSTLLNILGGMDTLSSGSVFLDGAELSEFDQKQMIKYRRFDVGFVPAENLVGRASVIFFSLGNDTTFREIWRWPANMRWDRLFKVVE